MKIGTGNQGYGIIQDNFEIELPDSGYIVLTGKNNRGKSSIIQLLFSKLVRSIQEVKANQVCLLLPERIYVHLSMETGHQNLSQFNDNLASQMHKQPLPYGNHTYNSHELFRLLVGNTEFRKLLDRGDASLSDFGFPKMNLGVSFPPSSSDLI